MIVILSDKKSRTEKEISEFLYAHGGDFISDRVIHRSCGSFTVIELHRKTNLKIDKGIIIITGSCENFGEQRLPPGMLGICEYGNRGALTLFKKNRIPVIGCGMDSRSTVTISSFSENTLIVSLRRTVTDINGIELEPSELKLNLNTEYKSFSAMAAATALLLLGKRLD